MGKEQKHGEVSDQGLFVVVILILAGACGRYIDRLEAWGNDHWFFLSAALIGAIYGLIHLLRFRWRMKNPELYERELAIKAMGKGHEDRKGFFEGAGTTKATKGEITVGQTIKDRKTLCMTKEQRCGHVQIVGATGRGKTQSVILPWFIQDLENGNSPVLIDGKGDEDLARQIEQHIGWHGYAGDFRKFDLSDPANSCAINPLEGGTPQEAADRLIASLEFESSYYRDVQHQAVLMLFELMQAAGWPYTFQGIYLALTDKAVFADLMKNAGEVSEALKNEAERFQAMAGKDREERYSGLISQVRPFATGDLLHIVNGRSNKRLYLSLTDLMQRDREGCPQAAVILLNTMRSQKAAKVLGKIILQTLAWATSMRKGEERFTPIFLDEFSSFVYDGFEQFLNKSRSYRVGLHLSHQSVGDFEKISPSFMKTMNVNTNVKCLLGLNDPDTADYFAKHLGTKHTVKQTERGKAGMFGSLERTGEMSLRDVDEYKVHPNKLRNFSRGQGVLSLLVQGIPVTEEVQFEAYKLKRTLEVA